MPPRGRDDFRTSIPPSEYNYLYYWRPLRWAAIGLAIGLLPSACFWCGAWVSGWGH